MDYCSVLSSKVSDKVISTVWNLNSELRQQQRIFGEMIFDQTIRPNNFQLNDLLRNDQPPHMTQYQRQTGGKFKYQTELGIKTIVTHSTVKN